MNPEIAFKEIADLSHSIILTSGTLSPMISFQKELHCQFDSVFEAPHIVGAAQTFLASISRGPTGFEMQAVHRNIEKLSFKDELGRMLLECCKIVPNGILCFLPSFSFMENLLQRWKDTQLIDEVRKHKLTFTEPRNTSDMEDCMTSYYKEIEIGAVLFAVYRGKASEGIDFADDAARLVITVGIPYPPASDPKVVLKKYYNTIKNEEIKGTDDQYLTGNQWYCVQAFRALNQAIGRCIRHSGDWGAMIMIDSRFDGFDPSYTNGLCKWIKKRKNHFDNWNDLYFSLQNFMDRHMQIRNKENEVHSV